MSEQATCGCGKMTLAANERMGTLAGGATVKKAFCFDCLTLLESDGETVTVTRLVRAVTPEAVKATWLFRLLDYAAKHNPFDPEKVTHLDVFGEGLPEAYPQYDSEIWSFGDVALVNIHWGDYDEPLIVAIEGLTDDGRTIHAALATGEPGEPTADELLDALEGFLRQNQWNALQYELPQLIGRKLHSPVVRGQTLRDLARAIIAQRGGKE